MFGVVKGLYTASDDRVDELNQRIAARNDAPAPPFVFSPRPVPTKYCVMPIMGEVPPSEVPIKYAPAPNAAFLGYMGNVDTESTLRNITFALQQDPRATYIPSTASDLYQVDVPAVPVAQPHKLLFASVAGRAKPTAPTPQIFYNANPRRLI
jgi:hypothetical protein